MPHHRRKKPKSSQADTRLGWDAPLLWADGSRGAHGLSWWWFQGPDSPEASRPDTSRKLERLRDGGRWVPPAASQAALVFLRVLGRKYPCDPASFFLRQDGRQRERSGATRPSGRGSSRGFVLVLEGKSARLALRIRHCQEMALIPLIFWFPAKRDAGLTGLQTTLHT